MISFYNRGAPRARRDMSDSASMKALAERLRAWAEVDDMRGQFERAGQMTEAATALDTAAAEIERLRGGASVKTLVWEENKSAREKLCKQWLANTPFGTIWIEHKKKFWISSDGVGQWRIYHETLEHAKAAAQADYEARIRSAIQGGNNEPS